VMIMCVTLTLSLVHFPMWGSMFLWGDESSEEDYYLNEWSAHEIAMGLHSMSMKFAIESRSQRCPRISLDVSTRFASCVISRRNSRNPSSHRENGSHHNPSSHRQNGSHHNPGNGGSHHNPLSGPLTGGSHLHPIAVLTVEEAAVSDGIDGIYGVDGVDGVGDTSHQRGDSRVTWA
jgi:hypothetical protein